jgi:predicted  nucleic acid-binding Zn-ribbon protein
MPKNPITWNDPIVLEAALEGLELQKQRIEAQIQEIRSRLGRRSRNAAEAPRTATKRILSTEARKRIAAAQKKRWAEYRRKSNSSSS